MYVCMYVCQLTEYKFADSDFNNFMKLVEYRFSFMIMQLRK